MGEGGIIGKLNPSTATSASGVWSVNEVFLRNTVTGEWPNFNAPLVSYSVLSGGGGGSGISSGQNGARGGGSGAIPVEGTFFPIAGVANTVTVGAGGGGSSTAGTVTPGGTSSITGIATGSAGANDNAGTGADNASFSGGAFSANGAGGGGAGAGGDAAASSHPFVGGPGGTGVVMPLHPTGLRVGGGGGGGGYNSSYHGSATDGGGKSGSSPALPGVNRGGGGGGASKDVSSGQQTGGSGRVILRYVDTFPAATATTGNPTITVSGGYRYYDFTSSGSFTF